MISVWAKISDSFLQTLKGNVGWPVFARDALGDTKTNYILLEGESDSEQPVKSIAYNLVIFRVKIVTLFETIINEQIAYNKDTEIERLVRGIPGSQLVKQDDIQILEVTRLQSVPLSYVSNNKKIFEVNTRYSISIFQKLNT